MNLAIGDVLKCIINEFGQLTSKTITEDIILAEIVKSQTCVFLLSSSGNFVSSSCVIASTSIYATGIWILLKTLKQARRL